MTLRRYCIAVAAFFASSYALLSLISGEPAIAGSVWAAALVVILAQPNA